MSSKIELFGNYAVRAREEKEKSLSCSTSYNGQRIKVKEMNQIHRRDDPSLFSSAKELIVLPSRS